MPKPAYPRPAYFEFFAGGGMARLGLESNWDCAFANEWSRKKADAYVARFGSGRPRRCAELFVGDVASLTPAQIPRAADLAWASFPCQDLSLAGMGAGLRGSRSGTFRPFWKLIQRLARDQRAPRIVVLENVTGAITSHQGKDFGCLMETLADGGYRAGAMVIDAVRFLPQSRPRLFIVGIEAGAPVSSELSKPYPSPEWHTSSLCCAYQKLSPRAKNNWLWWHLPTPPERRCTFRSIIEEQPSDVAWHTPEQTQTLLRMMSRLNLAKVREAQAEGKLRIGTLYRRTRPIGDGEKAQRAEVRFDDVAGCLRTPTGGSSRQTIVVVEGRRVRSRLLSSREAARLMGVPDDYPVPANYNEAYHLFGDGLAVPVVRWLSQRLLLPLALETAQRAAA